MRWCHAKRTDYEEAKQMIPELTYEEYVQIEELAKAFVDWMNTMSRDQRKALNPRR